MLAIKIVYVIIALFIIAAYFKAKWDVKMINNGWPRKELYKMVSEKYVFDKSFNSTVIRLHGRDFLTSLINHHEKRQ